LIFFLTRLQRNEQPEHAKNADKLRKVLHRETS
jgi:hypothetical protein